MQKITVKIVKITKTSKKRQKSIKQTSKKHFQSLLDVLDDLMDVYIIFTMPNSDSDGRIIVGRDFKGSSSGLSYGEEARQLVDAAREMLIDRTLSFDSFMVGKRPVPSDGLPVVGRSSRFSGLYIMAMHSGITLAPLVGRLGVAEILSGHILSELQDYRPDRFS